MKVRTKRKNFYPKRQRRDREDIKEALRIVLIKNGNKPISEKQVAKILEEEFSKKPKRQVVKKITALVAERFRKVVKR